MKYKSKNIFVLVYVYYGTTFPFLSSSVLASAVSKSVVSSETAKVKTSSTGVAVPASPTVTQTYVTVTPTVTSVLSVMSVSIKGQSSATTLAIEPTKSTILVVNSTPVDKAKSTCNPNQNDCQNGGRCVGINESFTCCCKEKYYGDRCQYTEKFQDLYKQLTYAFGGTTGFLLLVIICLICSRRSTKKKRTYKYSEELDNFTVANKRASTKLPGSPNSPPRAYDMYASDY